MQNEIHITDEEIEFDDILMRYLRNELSTEEERKFVELLESDPDKKARAAAVARLIKGLKNHAKAEDNKIIESFKAKQPKTVKLFVRILAAAVIVGFGLFSGLKFYNNAENQKIAAEFGKEITISENMRGSSDEDIINELNTLFSNVEKDTDLNNTIAKLESLWQQSRSEIFNDYTNYSTNIGKALTIAYIKNNDRKAAEKVLNQMIETFGAESQASNWAEKVLERIK